MPLQVTAFVGRDEAIAEIVALLEKSRLVTLVGTGGVGKTRTALQAAADLLETMPGGVWFVEFAPLVDGSLVAGAVSSALGVPPAADRPVLDAIVAYLKERRLLLVFDNCEHVVAEAARIADAIVRACPQVKLLATSREGLNVAGERVYRMPSLRVPPPGEQLRAVDAATYESVALFADRAAAADGRFSLTDENASTVADICRRLDGIALAIELAAPRVKVLAVHQLSQRLDERFRLLTGGARTALPRQQTMRALIDWSFDLLSENEKTLFRRLAVFAGGWTIEAATEICADDLLESWDILDLLAALVDKSLVATELSGSHQRYRLLESMRQYARERLAGASDAVPLARRHGAYFCRIAEGAYPSSHFMAEREWLAPLAPEIDNFRTALNWTLGEGNDVPAGAAATGVLFRLFDRLSLVDEGIRWCETALAMRDVLDVSTVARLHFAHAFLLNNSNRTTLAISAAHDAVRLYRSTSDEAGLCAALSLLANGLAIELRYDEARAVGEEAVVLARKVGDSQLMARALQFHGIAFEPENIEEARALFRESTGIFRTLGRTTELGNAFVWWAEAEAAARNFERAIELSRESLELARPLDRQLNFANIANYALSMSDFDAALAPAREAFASALKDRRPVMTAFGMLALALIETRDGDCARAARLSGYAHARLKALNAQLGPTERVPAEMLEARLAERFEENELARLMNEGVGWSEEQAAAEALRV